MAALLVGIIILKLIPCCQNNNTSSTKTEDSQNESQTQNPDVSNSEMESIQITSTIASKNTSTTSFQSFQIKFTITFLLAMFGDWLTGPYLYQLYKKYIGNKQSIAVLYVIGFASSAFVSSFIGGIADKFGRKKMCLLFCITYAICALVKHSDNYWVLVFARFLGGLSTSILFSCFESWMISEHHNLGFKSEKLGSTFQLVWGLNSIVAIIAGPVAQLAFYLYKKHFQVSSAQVLHADVDGWSWWTVKTAAIAPFDLSALSLVVTFVTILIFWKNENYGNSEIHISESLKKTMNVLFGGKNFNTVMVGLLSACFEGAMYIFVFQWWDILHNNRTPDENSPGISNFTAMIFTVFMMGCLFGTTLNGVISKMKHETRVVIFCAVAGLVFFIQKWFYKGKGDFRFNYELNFGGFIIYEICVGMYWPIIGGLRERYIPDEIRATVMNLFRIPLNMITVVGILLEDILGGNVFILLGVLMIVASGCALKLCFAEDLNGEDEDAVDKGSIVEHDAQI